MSPHTTEPVVTRTEIVDAIGEAFTGSEVDKQTLVDTAQRSDARREVIDLLSCLPERRYWQPQQIWLELPEIQIDAP